MSQFTKFTKRRYSLGDQELHLVQVVQGVRRQQDHQVPEPLKYQGCQEVLEVLEDLGDPG